VDTNAMVINVRMGLFGWELEQVEGFCDYGDLVFNNKLLFPEFIDNCRSLLQTYCFATLWLYSNVERTTSSNITFRLLSSNMNLQMIWFTGKTSQKFIIASCNEGLYVGDAPATVVLHKVDAPGQNCQTIPGID
jgi:hypothetical protein